MERFLIYTDSISDSSEHLQGPKDVLDILSVLEAIASSSHFETREEIEEIYININQLLTEVDDVPL